MSVNSDLPVVLFAYNRPVHLQRTLNCLKENRVPILFVYSDGPRTPDVAPMVAQVRNILHAIDWCDVVLCEREHNLGLGRSILTGVSEILSSHEMCIVFEDDLVCVPGTYLYMSAALNRYRDESRVMSVTGWTHPLVTPTDVADAPYFDGRAECLVWGTWARAWQGMDQDAKSLMLACEAQGIDRNKYGSDLPQMAEGELRRNIWAVRWLYHHIAHGGLCMRPPWSMVEHIGFDSQATNSTDGSKLVNPPLKPCPPLPTEWPRPVEHPQCPSLERRFNDALPVSPTEVSKPGYIRRLVRNVLAAIGDDPAIRAMNKRDLVKQLVPPLFMGPLQRLSRLLRATPNASSKAPFPIEWEYIPEGWKYAAKHSQVRGWNVEEVLSIYQSKWPRFLAMVDGKGPLGAVHEANLSPEQPDLHSHNIHMTFGYVLALATWKCTNISILDWGGGIGHYFVLAQALAPHIAIDYHCKDMPLLATYGAELFPDQSFYSDERCLERQYDLVITSTSLQYSEQWKDVLSALAKAAHRYLYVAQLPVVATGPSFVFVQRPYAYGYNTEYLGWCLNKEEFMAHAEGLGLRLEREFVYGHAPLIDGAPYQATYWGFLFSAPSR